MSYKYITDFILFTSSIQLFIVLFPFFLSKSIISNPACDYWEYNGACRELPSLSVFYFSFLWLFNESFFTNFRKQFFHDREIRHLSWSTQATGSGDLQLSLKFSLNPLFRSICLNSLNSQVLKRHLQNQTKMIYPCEMLRRWLSHVMMIKFRWACGLHF